MQELFVRGYSSGLRPSGHVISKKWAKNNSGAIPPNIIEASNTKSTDPYIAGCRKIGLEVHPARFADKVPEFFIKFLTRPKDIVLDPFAGSNVVGAAAERLGRRWISAEICKEYVVGSQFRFENPTHA
jgi:site-specific DNA-methyltransferase (cytosine-N4-specific)